MTKVTFQYINGFILTAFVVCLASLQTRADVIYAMPLKGVELQIGNLLEWSTSFEKNSHTFIVEKSLDGVNFSKTGKIDAAGYSNYDKSYRFLDLSASEKKMYYRLKQLDIDGTSNYSEIISIKKEMANRFMVVAMSNAAVNTTFDVTIDAIEKIDLEFSLKNKEGDLLSKANQTLYEGLNDVQIDLENEKEGVYFIILRVDQEEEMLVIRKIDDPAKKKANFASKKPKKGG